MSGAIRTEFHPGWDGALLAVHRMGAGRPLVMLHGLFSSAEVNWVKYGHAARLAMAGFEVIMPDLRGHGESAAPHEAEAYPKDVLARDLAALVAGLGLADYDLAGFSLGARTSVRAVVAGLAPARLVLGGMGLEGLTGWGGRSAFFIDVIDRFGSIAREEGAAFMAQAFLKSQGVPDAIDARGLRALPVELLLKTQLMSERGAVFVDGTIVPDSVGKLFAEGRQHAVPFLLGANSHEGSTVVAGPNGGMAQIAPDVSREQLEALYGRKSETGYAQYWYGDSRFLAAARYLAGNMARAGGEAGAPAYLYYFSYRTQAQRDYYSGVRHADDLPYVFQRLAEFETGAGPADYRISSLMGSYWTNFAKTGDPNGPGLPRWDAYRASDDNWFEIGENGLVMKPGLLAERLEWHIARFKRAAGIP